MATTDQQRVNGALAAPRPAQAIETNADLASVCPDCGGVMRETPERARAPEHDAALAEQARTRTCVECNRSEIVRALSEPAARRQRLELHDRGTDALLNDAMPPT